jgi:hypothetical protein
MRYGGLFFAPIPVSDHLKTLIMKKLLLVAVLGLFVLAVNAQDAQKIKDNDVPQAVKTAFEKEFPNTTLADWKIKDGNYKASFTNGSKKQMAEFGASGELISKGEKISKDELPTPVGDAVKQGYSSSDVGEIYRVEKGGQTLYLVKLEGNAPKKLVYDAQGKQIK